MSSLEQDEEMARRERWANWSLFVEPLLLAVAIAGLVFLVYSGISKADELRSRGPAIESITPSPVPGSTAASQIVIEGRGFAYRAVINLRDVTAGITYPNRPAVTRMPERIVLAPNLGNRAHRWTVEVVNPDGQTTGAVSFLVQPSLPALARKGTPSPLVPVSYPGGSEQGPGGDGGTPSLMVPAGGADQPRTLAPNSSFFGAGGNAAPLQSSPPGQAGAAGNPSLTAGPAAGGAGADQVTMRPYGSTGAQQALRAMTQNALHSASATPALRTQQTAAPATSTAAAPLHATARAAPAGAPAPAGGSAGSFEVGSGAAAGAMSLATNAWAGMPAGMDQTVKPEALTAVLVSNRDVNRIVCDSQVDDVIWSKERPVEVSKSGSNVFVKFLIQKLGDRYTYVNDPVDVHIVCDDTVYTLVLHPQATDSMTVRLTAPVAKVVKRIAREWNALPLEDKVERLTLAVFKNELPEGFQRVPVHEGDARRHVVLYDGSTAQPTPVPGVHITGQYEVAANGAGLRATEYEVVSDQARELRETDFLDGAFGDEVGVTVDPLRVQAGEAARLIVVTRSVSDGP